MGGMDGFVMMRSRPLGHALLSSCGGASSAEVKYIEAASRFTRREKPISPNTLRTSGFHWNAGQTDSAGSTCALNVLGVARFLSRG